MTVVDWILLVVWAGITLSGFWKGAIRLVFGVGGFLVGLWLAVAVGDGIAAELGRYVGPDWVAQILGRLLPLLGCVAVCAGAGWGLDRTLRALRLGWVNRLAGAVLAAAIMAVLLGVVLSTGASMSPAWAEQCSRSLLAPRLMALVGQGVEPTAVDDPLPVDDDR